MGPVGVPRSLGDSFDLFRRHCGLGFVTARPSCAASPAKPSPVSWPRCWHDDASLLRRVGRLRLQDRGQDDRGWKAYGGRPDQPSERDQPTRRRGAVAAALARVGDTDLSTRHAFHYRWPEATLGTMS